MGAKSPGWYKSGCSGSPNFNGTPVTPAPILVPPETNSKLSQHRPAAVQLHRPGADLPQRHEHDRRQRRNLHRHLLGLDPLQRRRLRQERHLLARSTRRSPPTTRSLQQGCGNVYVNGTYTGQLTIAAENDIIINGNLCRTSCTSPSGEALLGLIANNFVRVYHPCSSDTNGTGSLSQPDDRRRDPGDQTLLHRRQLQLRQPARHPQRRRRDRAEVPRPGRHRRLRRFDHRLHQELRLRRPPALPRAAELHRTDRRLLGHRPRDPGLMPARTQGPARARQPIASCEMHRSSRAKREKPMVGLEIEAGSVAAAEVGRTASPQLRQDRDRRRFPTAPSTTARSSTPTPSPRRCSALFAEHKLSKRVRLGNRQPARRRPHPAAAGDRRPQGARRGGPLPGPGADPDADRPGRARPPRGRRRRRPPRTRRPKIDVDRRRRPPRHDRGLAGAAAQGRPAAGRHRPLGLRPDPRPRRHRRPGAAGRRRRPGRRRRRDPLLQRRRRRPTSPSPRRRSCLFTRVAPVGLGAIADGPRRPRPASASSTRGCG